MKHDKGLGSRGLSRVLQASGQNIFSETAVFWELLQKNGFQTFMSYSLNSVKGVI